MGFDITMTHHLMIKDFLWPQYSFITKIYISSRGTTQKRSQPQHGRITQIWVVEGMIEIRFWEVIGEPKGDFSRLRDQEPRKHDFAQWRW